MKRFALLLIPLLLLSGCALPGSDAAEGKKLLDSISPYYQTDVRYESGGLAVTATIDNTAPDACTVTVTGPEHLRGYAYRMGENGIEVTYRDLTFSLDPTGAGSAAPLLQAVSALAALLRPGPEDLPARQDGFWTLTGTIDSGDVTLTLREEDGLPAKLSLQGAASEIILENFVFFG